MRRTKRVGINQNGGYQEQQENTVLDVARRTKRVGSDIENHSSDVHLNDMSDRVSNNPVNSVEVKTRGTTNMPRVWARSEQVEVEFNEIGKPIGENKSEYVEFIGTLARNWTLLPLDNEDWHKVPMSTKENLFKLIKEKYCGTTDFQNVSWNTVSKSWKSWKTRVKNKYFDSNASMEENLRKRPDIDDGRIELDQWKNLVIQWSSDKDRKRSAQNKENRAKKKMMHIIGKKSFSQVKYQMKVTL